MIRMIALVLTLMVSSTAFGGGYSYSNGYYWKGGYPYSRYVYKNCYSSTGYSYGYSRANYYPTTNTNNSRTYTYNINYAQPAAQQGNTLYGVPSTQLSLQSYGNVDLGATVDGLLRLSSDMQTGVTGVAGEARALAADIAGYAAAQNQAVAAVAEIQAQAELLRAAKPSGQLNLQYQGGGHTGGYGGHGGGDPGPFQGSQGNGGGKWGPLVTQYCANCHGDNGSNRDIFSLDEIFTFEGYRRANEFITHDDPTLRMPKGTSIDADTRGAILNEMNVTVKNFLLSQSGR